VTASQQLADVVRIMQILNGNLTILVLWFPPGPEAKSERVLLHTIMSWRAELGKHVKELRFLVSAQAPSSAAVRLVLTYPTYQG